MAEGLGSWGPNSEGAHQNDPALSDKPFKATSLKRVKGQGLVADVSPEEREGQVHNALKHFDAASPTQKHNGAMFYPRSRGEAMRVGMGINPGVLKSEETPIGQVPTRVAGTRGQNPAAISAAHAGAARSRVMGATPTRQVSAPRTASDIPSSHGGPHRPGVVQHSVISAAIDRGAAGIAALSPSSPAGMDYEHNAHAAHEALTVSHAQAGALQHYQDIREPPEKLPKGQKRSKAEEDALKSPERLDILKGKTSLQHAGNSAILKAHAVLSGEKSPEEVLPMDIKTGHFYQNIRSGGKDEGSTIDGRSHDLIRGDERYPWNAARGLTAKSRYSHFMGVNATAAGRRGVSASTMQATGWLQDKGDMLEQSSDAEKAMGRAPQKSRGAGVAKAAPKAKAPKALRTRKAPAGVKKDDDKLWQGQSLVVLILNWRRA